MKLGPKFAFLLLIFLFPSKIFSFQRPLIDEVVYRLEGLSHGGLEVGIKAKEICLNKNSSVLEKILFLPKEKISESARLEAYCYLSENTFMGDYSRESLVKVTILFFRSYKEFCNLKRIDYIKKSFIKQFVTIGFVPNQKPFLSLEENFQVFKKTIELMKKEKVFFDEMQIVTMESTFNLAEISMKEKKMDLAIDFIKQFVTDCEKLNGNSFLPEAQEILTHFAKNLVEHVKYVINSNKNK